MCYLEVTCGENPRAGLDYLNHYRSPHLLGIDADYQMSRHYRSTGWPSFVVVDAEGIVRFHGPPSDARLTEVRQCVETLLAKPAPDGVAPLQLEGGIAIPASLQDGRQLPRDRFPRLALDVRGQPLVVYHSRRGGTNAVVLRRLDATGQSRDDRLSAPDQEAYAADAVVDPTGTLWVVWCGRKAGTYNVWLQERPSHGDPSTQQLTFSDDDAMAPRIAAGQDGTLVVTFYQWRKMRGISRDRDVFARVFDPRGRVWGDVREVSPPVPEVEDHADPHAVVEGSGRVWVAWSYDYHPQLFKDPVAADQPTIFAASLEGSKASEPLLVGATGEHPHSIDLFPSLALDAAGVLWCAWDGSEPERSIRLARFEAATNGFRLVSRLACSRGICSTPSLASAGTKGLLVAWSERVPDGNWRGRVQLVRGGRPMAKCILEEPGADVMDIQVRQDANGGIWVAYEKATEKESEVVVRRVDQQLAQTPR